MATEGSPLWESLLADSGVIAKPFYDSREVASILGVSKSTVTRWKNTGLLKAANFGPRRVVFLHDTLRDWVGEIGGGL